MSVSRVRTEICIERAKEIDSTWAADLEAWAFTSEARLREELARPWSHTWVARDSERAVVALLVAWHVADELHVLTVATRPDRRRRGMGRALMNAALSYAREQRVKRVLLEVRRSNEAAIALYRALGFHTTRVRLRYYPDEEDALEMALLLVQT